MEETIHDGERGRRETLGSFISCPGTAPQGAGAPAVARVAVFTHQFTQWAFPKYLRKLGPSIGPWETQESCVPGLLCLP